MAEDKHPVAEEKIYDLLSRSEQGLEITARDDQNEFAAFLDAARAARRSGGRLRLIDTAKFSVYELEWLAEAGADLYTSDEARPNRSELGLLSKACSKGDAFIAYLHRSELTGGAAESPTSAAFLAAVGRDGVDIHVSNRERPRDWALLSEVAYACLGVGSRLAYYHHGPLDSGLGELVRSGCWLHLSDLTSPLADEGALLADFSAEAAASGSGLVVHLDKGLAADAVRDLLKAGAFVIFKTPPADRRSPFRALERQARKRMPDRRTYYLYLDFLP
jgi:hypothetical protein